MKRVLISQIKQLHKGKSKYITFIFLIVVVILNIGNFYLDKDISSIENSACMFFSTGYFIFFAMVQLFIGVSVADICSGDFADKTFYNEILSGQSRFNSYFGRAVVALVFTLIGSMILVIFPVVLCSFVCGWGTLFTVEDVVKIFLIAVFPIIRIICMYIGLAFILKKFAVYTFMAGFSIATMCMEGFFSKAPPEILGATSLYRLCTFDIWVNYGLNDTYTPVIDTTIPTGEIQSIIIWSLIASAVFLIIGYAYFHNDDLN